LLASATTGVALGAGADGWTVAATDLLTLLAASFFVSEAGEVMIGFLSSTTVFLDMRVILGCAGWNVRWVFIAYLYLPFIMTVFCG